MHTQTQQQLKAIASAIKSAYPEAPSSYTYLTVRQFSERNPAFTEPSVRNLVFKADSRESSFGTIPGNGLLEAGAIIRIGRKVLIHEESFSRGLRGSGCEREHLSPLRQPRCSVS